MMAEIISNTLYKTALLSVRFSKDYKKKRNMILNKTSLEELEMKLREEVYFILTFLKQCYRAGDFYWGNF